MLKPTKTFSFTYSLKGFDASVWNEGFFVPLHETVFSLKKKKKGSIWNWIFQRNLVGFKSILSGQR